MFERFSKMSEEELRKLSYTDFTSTELEIIIYDTVMTQNDRAIANRCFIHGDDYARIAEVVSYIPKDDMKTTTTSERSVKNHRKDIISQGLQETVVRLVPYWDRDFENNWLRAQELILSYYRIKKDLHYI